jgi:type I restriction enzyme, S subunit
VFAVFNNTNIIIIENQNQSTYLTKLRQAILQEAIEGKLTADWRKENPVRKGDPDYDAEALLEKIQAEKEKLIKLKELKKGKLPKDSKSFRNLLEIPKQWVWVKADEVYFITKLAGFEYTKYIVLLENGDIPVIRAQNVRPLNIDKTNLLYIDEETSEKLGRCALTKECLLVTFIGAGIGDVATFMEKERWHLAPNVAKMEPFKNCDNYIYNKYCNYFLLSNSGQREVFKHMKATAQPSLSMETIRDIDFPLPPLSEQQAIVNRVEKLLTMIDELEKQVSDRKEQLEQLMQAVLREAFEGGN